MITGADPVTPYCFQAHPPKPIRRSFLHCDSTSRNSLCQKTYRLLFFIRGYAYILHAGKGFVNRFCKKWCSFGVLSPFFEKLHLFAAGADAKADAYGIGRQRRENLILGFQNDFIPGLAHIFDHFIH